MRNSQKVSWGLKYLQKQGCGVNIEDRIITLPKVYSSDVHRILGLTLKYKIFHVQPVLF